MDKFSAPRPCTAPAGQLAARPEKWTEVNSLLHDVLMGAATQAADETSTSRAVAVATAADAAARRRPQTACVGARAVATVRLEPASNSTSQIPEIWKIEERGSDDSEEESDGASIDNDDDHGQFHRMTDHTPEQVAACPSSELDLPDDGRTQLSGGLCGDAATGSQSLEVYPYRWADAQLPLPGYPSTDSPPIAAIPAMGTQGPGKQQQQQQQQRIVSLASVPRAARLGNLQPVASAKTRKLDLAQQPTDLQAGLPKHCFLNSAPQASHGGRGIGFGAARMRSHVSWTNFTPMRFGGPATNRAKPAPASTAGVPNRQELSSPCPSENRPAEPENRPAEPSNSSPLVTAQAALTPTPPQIETSQKREISRRRVPKYVVRPGASRPIGNATSAEQATTSPRASPPPQERLVLEFRSEPRVVPAAWAGKAKSTDRGGFRPQDRGTRSQCSLSSLLRPMMSGATEAWSASNAGCD
jgi:hypothetical protein